MTNNLFLPLRDPWTWFCEVGSCENIASWICHPQGYLAGKIHMCDECKAEAERQEAARQSEVCNG